MDFHLYTALGNVFTYSINFVNLRGKIRHPIWIKIVFLNSTKKGIYINLKNLLFPFLNFRIGKVIPVESNYLQVFYVICNIEEYQYESNVYHKDFLNYLT